MTAKKQINLSQDTLIPVSFLVVLTGVIYFISQISSLAESNHEGLIELEKQRQKVDIRLFDRLQNLEGELGDVKSQVGLVNGKLDLLIELRGEKMKPSK